MDYGRIIKLLGWLVVLAALVALSAWIASCGKEADSPADDPRQQRAAQELGRHSVVLQELVTAVTAEDLRRGWRGEKLVDRLLAKAAKSSYDSVKPAEASRAARAVRARTLRIATETRRVRAAELSLRRAEVPKVSELLAASAATRRFDGAYAGAVRESRAEAKAALRSLDLFSAHLKKLRTLLTEMRQYAAEQELEGLNEAVSAYNKSRSKSLRDYRRQARRETLAERFSPHVDAATKSSTDPAVGQLLRSVMRDYPKGWIGVTFDETSG